MTAEDRAACDGAIAAFVVILRGASQAIEAGVVTAEVGIASSQLYMALCEVLRGKRPTRCGVEDDFVREWTAHLEQLRRST